MYSLHHLDTLADKLDVNYSVFTKSGTVAIWLALKSLDLRDENIIVPANVCHVVVIAIILSGNQPLVVDINNDGGGINIGCLSNIEDSKVGAVIYPYMYGDTGNILNVKNVCSKKGWILIEDIAQAFGAKIDNVYAGGIGDVSVLSFGVGKPIDLRIGGAINFNSEVMNAGKTMDSGIDCLS